MRKIALACVISYLLLLFIIRTSHALNVDTHELIDQYVAKHALNVFSLNDYLINNLGFTKGTDEKITRNGLVEITTMTATNGPVTKLVPEKKTHEVYIWLMDGGRFEDEPPATMPYLRSVNHFHNPLKPLDKAGFTGIWDTGFLKGKSAVLWSQSPKKNQSPGGYYSWNDVRNYLYTALTATNPDDRSTNYADTFRGLGQLMHLVQDMSVPEHTRNEGHYIAYMYENWVSKAQQNPDIQIRVVFENALANPIYFDMNTLRQTTAFGAAAAVPIANLFDRRQYNGNNPDVTIITDPSTMAVLPSPTIGLAEYTNANFFSPSTIYTKPTFTYPSKTSSMITESRAIPDPFNSGQSVMRYYSKKIADGDRGYLLVARDVIGSYQTMPWQVLNTFLLDDKVYADYASHLLPRAVGYSAELLNYFLRGDLKLGYKTNDTPGYVVINNTDEDITDGLFALYYDNASSERKLLGNGTFSLAHGAQSDLFDFIPPTDAKEPGKYILVFKGKLGNEEGAVAGSVFRRILEITPPDSYVYSLVDASRNPAQFTQVKAKVRNTDTDEAIQNGTLVAIAKYKKTVDDLDFSYSVSAPQAITALNSATEFTFDFTASPIPVTVTDLYLQVIPARMS